MAKPTAQKSTNRWSRRKFVKGAGSTALVAATGSSLITPRRVRARRKTLKILQWKHFVPAYDDWFNNEYIHEWGEKNDTEVIVDNVGMTSLKGRADAQVAAQKGHDLFLFLNPPPVYEQHTVDHRDIYEECARNYGQPIDLATKSTYNPKTNHYFGFSDSFVPDPINYRKDLWDDVGVFPSTWDDIRKGGRKIYTKHKVPMGLGLAPELDSNMALRSVLHAFGASVQNESGQPVLKSAQTLEALKFVKAMYQESMTDEVFTWDPSSNNRLLLAGRGSLTLNAISITRTGEDKKIPMTDRIWLAKAAKGPHQRIALQHLLNAYVIWKFADNIEGAKQFLVDYVGEFRKGFVASRFYNFPTFPKTVPDLKELIASDAQANPKDKYRVFDDVSDWVTNVGYPGNANAAIGELFSNWTISNMFAEAARGKMSPEQAMNAANGEVEKVFAKWKGLGMV